MLDYRAHTFIIAYRLRSFTRAAEELHITQPAVSQHIKQLEARVGCSLFETRGRAVRSTPAGDLLYRRLSVMANDEARIIDELRRLDSATVAPLRLGCTRTIADYVAPRLLAKHAQRHPEQTVHLRSANTRDLLTSLEMGELDLALVEGPYDRSSFDGSVLSTEPYVAVASPRKAQSAHALSDLLAHPIIVREKGSGTREILERMLAAQGLELGDFAAVIEVASIPVIKEFVRAGRGITFIYRVAVSEELSRGELVDLTPADCAAHHDFTLIWQQGSAYAESYRALLDEWRSDLP